jgi:adenosylmethionine-8-amino-7-oxononanoate aminotransferase
MTTEKVFSAFLGGYEETFFYGHSYCANPLGCAVALANLEVFEIDDVLNQLDAKIDFFRKTIKDEFEQKDGIIEIRIAGLIAGIEIGPFHPDHFVGAQVCLAARRHGLLTRPVRDTLVLMPPICAAQSEIKAMVSALGKAFREFVNKD